MGGATGAEIPKEYSVDIDTQFDYDMAKLMYEQLMQSVDWYAASWVADLASQKFLITGGAGLLGRAVAQELVMSGASVRLLT